MQRSGMAVAAVLGFAVAVGSPMARGGPLDPGAFTSLGTLNISSGSYTFNTTDAQLLDSSNNVLFQGVIYNGIAVFDFSQIAISGGTITTTGFLTPTPGVLGQPLALLSQGDISFTGGSINLDGTNGGATGGMATIRDKMGHCLHEFFTIVLLRAPAPHQSLIRGVGNDSSGLGSPWQMNAPQ